MKKILTFILLMLTMQMNAQNMKDIIRNMPDSIAPLLSKNARLDFIDYLDAGQKAVEKNKLGSQSEMLKLNDTRSLIQMTGSSTMDIKLLKNPETQVGIITTVKSDKVFTSIIKYYNMDWKLIKTIIPDGFKKWEWNDDNEEIGETIFNPLELKQE